MQDKKAEGAIPLFLAHIEERKTDDNTIFHIVTYVGMLARRLAR